MRSFQIRRPLLAAALAATLALGLAPLQRAGAAELGIYFDSAGTQDSIEVSAGTAFSFYAVAKGMGSGVIGYEFALEFSDAITILDQTPHPASHINVSNQQYSWNVGTNECHGGGGSVVLISFTAILLTDATNLTLRAKATSEPSIDEDTPAYVPCDDDQVVYGFDETPAAYVNSRADSFGRMKERFDG